MEIFITVDLSCAHFLPGMPENHPCRNMHGHTYRVEISLEGEMDPEKGWVMDFAELKAEVGKTADRLDHRVLNQVEGLENPTCENLAVWIWNDLRGRLPGLSRVRVMESRFTGCTYRGPGRAMP
jgi:6-pyruvoyltetrahydropterin/6-carboxytetrahydropterin synthase